MRACSNQPNQRYLVVQYQYAQKNTIKTNSSDIIIRGGENLFPVQIENTITNHRSIREAAVVAVPDTTYGETVGVWVVRHANEPTITRFELKQWVGKRMNPQV